MPISNANDTADAIRELGETRRAENPNQEPPTCLIEIDADEMLSQIMQFTQRNLRAIQTSNWEKFAANRQELDSWFLSHGIKLTSKE